MNKELNIIQAMEMPVGTKFNIDIEIDDAEFIEVLKGNDACNILCWDGDRDSQVRICTPTAKMKLTPIQQPVSFIEAIKASQEGKTIRVTVEDREYTYYPKKSKFLELRDKDTHGGLATQEILEGKWYIEESEEN